MYELKHDETCIYKYDDCDAEWHTIYVHLCLIYENVSCCASTWECSPLANCKRCSSSLNKMAGHPHSSLTTSSTSLSHLLPLCWGANSKTPDLTLLQISAPGTLSHGWRVQQPSLLPWLQHQRPPGWSPTWETEFLSYDKKLLIQGMLLWWGSAYWGNTREFLYLTLWDLQRRQGGSNGSLTVTTFSNNPLRWS